MESYDPLYDATDAQRELYAYMSDISEDCYCAGWMEGTEAALWDAVLGERTRWGVGVITQEEVTELKRLSDTAGGWWHLPESSIYHPIFLTVPEWEKVYADVWKSS